MNNLKKIKIILSNFKGIKNLTQEEFETFKNRECSYNLNSHLIRSYDDFTIDYAIITPRMRVRESLSFDNTILNIINKFPSWSKYPKRDRSIFMYNMKNGINIDNVPINGKYIYKVYPINNSILAVCPEIDMIKVHWKAIKKFTNDNIKNPKDFLYYIFGFFGHNSPDNVVAYSPKEFERLMTESYKILKLNNKNHTGRYDENLENLLGKYYKEYGSFYNWLDKNIFNPKENGFFLTHDINDIPDMTEVWTDSTCLIERINNNE